MHLRIKYIFKKIIIIKQSIKFDFKINSQNKIIFESLNILEIIKI
jgi:hypothetical protein